LFFRKSKLYKQKKVLYDKSGEFVKQGKFKESLDVLDEILELNPNDSKVLFMKSLNLVITNNFKEAVECLEHFLNKKPEMSKQWK
jgi:tetratricopeptide (TPR) repeat protein